MVLYLFMLSLPCYYHRYSSEFIKLNRRMLVSNDRLVLN